MVKMRDASRLTLTQRQIAEKFIDNENPDRNSLIYALAEGHGGQAYEPAARARRSSAGRSSFTPAGGSRMRKASGASNPDACLLAGDPVNCGILSQRDAQGYEFIIVFPQRRRSPA
jgi:hypothetical protein